MKRAVGIAVGALAAWGLVGCSKTEAPKEDPTTAAVGSAKAASAAAATPAVAAPAAAPSGAPGAAATPFDPASLGSIPESFETGTKVEVENAVGVGCETKVVGNWLELLCYNKNGTGGRPVRARLPALGLPGETTVQEPSPDGGTSTALREMLPEESGILHVVVPWKDGYTADGAIDWTDSRFLLHVEGKSAKLGWDTTLAMRKACALVEQNQQALRDQAVAKGTPDAPTKEELKKMPRFGRCQPAGFGSWAVSATAIGMVGEGTKRNVKVSLEAVWVDLEGKTTKADMGALEFAPQRFSIPRLVAFDYDADGKDEMIVTSELEGTANPTQKPIPAIWTFDGTKIAAYAKTPDVALGGLTTEQLENDMRPDLGSYGPFVAWLTPACGVAKCPDRITGPRLFAHADKVGGFVANDEATIAAGKRVCAQKPTTFVVPGAPVNVARTAQNVACARLWNVDTAVITADLQANKDKLCGGAAECELLTALTSWAAATTPFHIEK